MNKLEGLRQHSVVVADTGDIAAIGHYRPTDATTNPTLILAASRQADYQSLLEEAVAFGRRQHETESQRLGAAMDKLSVNFGCEILRMIPGRVSTEVDARLSFDARASIEKAHRLISLYEKAGVSRDRILIKLATTWEGVQAARELEREGIHCNMTLMFCLAQAVACAEAGATLVSPFVGRIYDWYRQRDGVDGYPPDKDPGVLSVTRVYHYFKKYGFSTEIMGASFRSKDQVLALAGCDLLTIAPSLLEELSGESGAVPPMLSPDAAERADLPRMEMDEARFRWSLNEDAMATEKLADGIRRFAVDAIQLERCLASLEV
ncbi:MAG: transaldolase [Pseudomonadota bacterium]|nr:transaldolase [Pseudomonadota bacterium]